MNCEICGTRDLETTVLLSKSQPDGKLVTFACVGCSIASGLYCQEHQRPHLGFSDGSSACKECIDMVVEKNGERLAGIFGATIVSSPKAEVIRQAIQRWHDLVSSLPPSPVELPLGEQFHQTPFSLNVIRAVVTRAQRMKITPEEVIQQVAKEGTGVILPPLDLDE